MTVHDHWLRALTVVVFVAASVSAAADIASCKKQAARDYAANMRSCEQNLRGLSVRLDRCKRGAKAHYDRARAACDAQARKAGQDPLPYLDHPPPRDPKPKDPPPPPPK
jgi:hypothetical protein